MSPEEEEDDEEVALEIITYIGLGISIIGLVLTIITYLLSRLATHPQFLAGPFILGYLEGHNNYYD